MISNKEMPQDPTTTTAHIGPPSRPRTPARDTGSLGEIIDSRYRLGRLLGEGGMGAVYAAEHMRLRKQVAIKLLHPAYGRMEELGLRFQREAFAAGRLKHPNCVGVTDFGRLPDGRLYLVMELLEGVSLGKLLEREHRVDSRRALNIVRHILRGLAHAHESGVVHRDLKPENIILVEERGDKDFAKLLDFGIAMLVGEASELDQNTLTQIGTTIGTPTYMAPERALGEKADHRSDLYSVTVILYELIAGVPPFSCADKLQQLAMHIGRPPPRIDELDVNVSVSEPLQALLSRGLAKRSADRPASAQEYIAEIDAILNDKSAAPAARKNAPQQPTPPAAPVIRPVGPRSAPVHRSSRRRLVLIGLAACLAIGLVASLSADSTQIPRVETAAGFGPTHAPPDHRRKTKPPSPPPMFVAAPEATEEFELTETEQAAEPTSAIAEIDALISAGRQTQAIKALRDLRKKHPRSAEPAYRLGNLYMERMWWSDGLAEYRSALSLNAAYREDPTLIGHAIRGLSSRSQPWRAERFLVSDIGEPAVAHLQRAANTKNKKLRSRILKVLKKLGAPAQAAVASDK